VSTVLQTGQEVRANRAQATHTSMFVRMLVRAAILRPGRAASALLAMIVAAAVTTAMMDLYIDVQAKLQREFRGYGANIVIVGKDGASLPSGARAQVDSVLAGHGVAAPFGLVVARTSNGQSVVVAGTDFDRVRQLDRWWSVSAWPAGSNQALVGVRALPVVSPRNQPFDLSFQGKMMHLMSAGTVRTGGAEDSRIYLSLADFAGWAGVQPSTIEVAASGSTAEIVAIMKQLSSIIPGAEVKPVRQIMEGEASVLGKTRSTLLAAAALIILTAALCVLSTLMGWVFDRRRDFAIMKALGASDRVLNGFFALEAALLGTIGAVIGFALGIGIAEWIGQANFHAAIAPHFSVLPIVLAGSILVTLMAAVFPISLLRRVEPAAILRGE
jgi:putative ABC transport system permease protein